MCKRNHSFRVLDSMMASKARWQDQLRVHVKNRTRRQREHARNGATQLLKPQSPQPVLHLLQNGRTFSCFRNSSTNERTDIQMCEPMGSIFAHITTLNTLVYFLLHHCLLPLKGSLQSSNRRLHPSSHSHKRARHTYPPYFSSQYTQ